MSKLTLEIRTDENGYCSVTALFAPRGPFPSTASLAIALLSPAATALWGTARIDARDDKPSLDARAFVVWHSETVQLGSWRLDDGEHVIVVTGKTKPLRANARLVLEIDVAM